MEREKKPIYNVLDLVPVIEEESYREAYLKSIQLAQRAEALGYHRYWVAEHHNMPGIASAATSVVMSYLAQATTTIRIGAGGIMLPNHSPLVIAEQFGTLEAMFPDRIDLGLGRAPGSDQRTMHALRRDPHAQGQDFPERLHELMGYFSDQAESWAVQAVPGYGQNIPIWLLGSSDFSAVLAGQLGLPFAFASHFMPANTMPALYAYRAAFKPSQVLKKPHVMVGINVYAAETEAHAAYISTSAKLSFLNLIRGKPGKLPKPVENIEAHWTPQEMEAVQRQLDSTIVGTPEQIKKGLLAFTELTQADEVIVVSSSYDFQDRVRSFEIVAEQMIEDNIKQEAQTQ